MQTVACPHCQLALTNDPRIAGAVVSCPQCRGSFQMPTLPAVYQGAPQGIIPVAQPAQLGPAPNYQPAPQQQVINQFFVAQDEMAGTSSGRRRNEGVPDGIKVPLLISGIFDILGGLSYTATILFAIIGIPMLLLGIFEVIQFSKAGSALRRDFASTAKTIAIFEILIGLFNLVSFICGIIVLVNASAVAREPKRRRRGADPTPDWLQ